MSYRGGRHAHTITPAHSRIVVGRRRSTPGIPGEQALQWKEGWHLTLHGSVLHLPRRHHQPVEKRLPIVWRRVRSTACRGAEEKGEAQVNARWILLLAFAGVASVPALGADKGLDLAKASDRYLDRAEALLARVSAQADRDAYAKEVFLPTSAELEKWPPIGDDGADRYRFCAFALNAFIGYADDQFKAGGKLPKTTITAKDYVEQRRRCKSVIHQR